MNMDEESRLRQKAILEREMRIQAMELAVKLECSGVSLSPIEQLAQTIYDFIMKEEKDENFE